MKKNWFDDFNRWSTPILANMLWVLLTIPVITMPLALVGLLAVMFQWMEEQDAAVFTVFFGTIRRNWWKCYIIFGIDLLAGGLIYTNLLLYQVMDMSDVLAYASRTLTFVFALLLIIVNIYWWTLLAIWDVPLKRILKVSVQLLFAQPIWSVVIALCVIAPIIFSTILPVAVFVTMSGAIAAYIACRGTWYVIGKYIPRSEFARIEID